jgi:hypothetical protein
MAAPIANAPATAHGSNAAAGTGDQYYQSAKCREMRDQQACPEKRGRVKRRLRQRVVVLDLEDRRGAEEDRGEGREYSNRCQTDAPKETG